MFLFFYYPADEYISYLMTVDELDFTMRLNARICLKVMIPGSGS